MGKSNDLEKLLRELIKDFEGTNEELDLQAALSRTEQLLKELLDLECRRNLLSKLDFFSFR
jgi:hypothetical protein